MTDPREQNSTCPMTWEEEPRGFLTEWEATPLKPTEDAKMQNDEAERLARDCATAAWCLKGAGEFESGQAILTEAAALIRAQAARIAELEPLATASIIEVAAWNPSVSEYMDHWEARAEAAEAEVARLREAIAAAERHLMRGHDKMAHNILRAALQPKQEDV